ncbi:MAG TPA: hypothetical protein VF170_06280, partial [Planctomycetaceae bacterium]
MDADGDPANGREAVALDLDHPVEETPDGAQKFIPIYGITIYDLDGLLNLNAHGNVYGVPENLASIPVNPFQFLSQSNEGRRPYEINPQMGLDAPPSTSGPEHSDFFGFAPTTATQLANMEWWFLTSGRADFDSSTGAIDRLHPGRWGVEAQRLEDAITNDRANPYAYPQPGDPFNDGGVGSVPDATRGMAFGGDGGLFPPGVLFPRPAHPEDHRGNGTFVALDGKTPLVRAIAGPGRVSTLAYLNYWFPQAPNANLNPAPLWSLAQSISGFNPPIVTWLALTGRIAAFTTAGTGASPFLLVDDPGETLLDPEQARDQVTDSIFPPEETAFLHLPGTNPAVDFNVVSRLLELAPANFTTDVPGGSLAVDRRKRFTTVSADLNAYSAAPERLRPWETRPDAPFDSA